MCSLYNLNEKCDLFIVYYMVFIKIISERAGAGSSLTKDSKNSYIKVEFFTAEQTNNTPLKDYILSDD